MLRVTIVTIAGLAFLGAARASDGETSEWGAGANVVTSYVFRDSTRSGPAVQPSAWFELQRLNAVVSAWSSVRLQQPRLDDLVFHARAGRMLGQRSWGAVGARWDWTPSHTTVRTTPTGPDTQRVGRTSVEVSALASWFRPPYRPTFMLAYDVVERNGLLAVLSIPYSLRIGGLPATTFIPEFGFRIRAQSNRVSLQYASFTAMMERRWRRFVIVPLASVVPRRGANLRHWILWGGVHLGATR